MKYKDYKVINSRHLRSLEALVALSIAKGWEPVGGVYSKPATEIETAIFILSDTRDELSTTDLEYHTETNWFQAMVLPIDA